MRRCFFILTLTLMLSAPLWARNADGTLGTIQSPHNGMPALRTPGASFSARLSARAELSLVQGENRIALDAEWTETTSDGISAQCRLPASVPPGTYTLEARHDSGVDQNQRAVYVLESFPKNYVVAHLSDTHLGKEREGRRRSEAINQDISAQVNASDAAFAVITGDLTENGNPEQFQTFLRVIDACALPTFVCPGNHDRQALNYEAYFAPLQYAFQFGEDGYLSFDTKDYNTASGVGVQDGNLQRLRRQLKPSRWCIGLTHRYEAMMGMRSQLTLFVDNPLDFLFFGHLHYENTADEPAVPWGTTPITVVPAAVNGSMRLIAITELGIKPRPFTTTVQTKQ